MNSNHSSGLIFYAYLAPLILPIYPSLYFNKKFKERHPKCYGYRWGYFLGFFLISFDIPCIFMLLNAISEIDTFGWAAALSPILMIFLFFLLGYFIIKRNRGVWVIMVVLMSFGTMSSLFKSQPAGSDALFQFSQMLGVSVPSIASFFYLKHRWNEMKCQKIRWLP